MAQLVHSIKNRGVRHEQDAPTLELRDVSVAYGSGVGQTTNRNGAATALSHVSFRVDSGERVAIVGPNGAGKSTLFKLIVGTLRPTGGAVNIFGHGPDGHICIGYVPQRSQIDWTFPVSVEDVVMMGRVGQIGLFRRPSRADWERVRAGLARVGVADIAQKQIGELSGGQQQRVFIARALAQEAELLLLDEPLTGLDVPTQESILDILDGLSDEGVTILVATHDLNLAAAHFDRVMLLNREIVAFGEPTAVLTTENLVQAYGGHLHRVGDVAETIVLAEGCCGEHETGAHQG